MKSEPYMVQIAKQGTISTQYKYIDSCPFINLPIARFSRQRQLGRDCRTGKINILLRQDLLSEPNFLKLKKKVASPLRYSTVISDSSEV